MLVLMVATYAVVGAVLGYVVSFWFADDGWLYGCLAFLLLALAMAVYSCVASPKGVLKGLNARRATPEGDRRLYRTVEELAGKAGVPMPEVYVCDVGMPNAFAYGRSPEKCLVAVTRPLLGMLDDDELEGVLGHELSHVLHRDTVVNGVARNSARCLSAAAMAMGVIGMVGLGAVGATSGAKGGGILGLVLLVILIPVIAVLLVLCLCLPTASGIMHFGVSRSREFGADESSGRITGKPLALASALVKIEEGCSESAYTPRDPCSSGLWILDPAGRRKKRILSRLFDTHPPTEERVRRLEALDMEINGRKRRVVR